MTAPNPPARPLVSVVIPAVNGPAILGECLDALARLGGGGRVEVLVFVRGDESAARAVRGRFPGVGVWAVDGRTAIPAIRALGVTRATGRFVAFTEDHCLVGPGWLDGVERAAADGREAVGGPVENACVDRTVDWAAFFCEYARFMPPVPAGAVGEIPANNMAIDRRVFDRLAGGPTAELWDSVLVDGMRRAGVAFTNDPGMAVRHKKSFGFGHFLSQRFHYSRAFAGERLRGRRWWARGGYAGAAGLLLPGLVLARILAVAGRKPGRRRELVRCLPVLAVFAAGWAAGEVVGAVLGPGRSAERVE